MPRTNIDIYTKLHGSRAKVKGLEDNLKTMESRAKKTGTSLSGLWKQVAAGMGLTMGIPALIRGVKNLAASFLDVAIEIEQYTIRLKTLLGSQKAANKAMDDFQDIASKLPFTLNEVIESGIRLTTIKVPFKDWLIPIADVAAAFGLDLPTATDQFARAMSAGLGAADWFREKGISAMIKDFAKLKYSIDDLSKAGTAKLKEVMFEWAKTFEGSSEDMAGTWSGMISMLDDAWFQFRATIMEAGIFDMLKEGLEDFLESVKKFKEEGKFEKWAADVGLHVTASAEALGLFKKAVDITLWPLKKWHEWLAKLSRKGDTYVDVVEAQRLANERLAESGADVTDIYKDQKEAVEELTKKTLFLTEAESKQFKALKDTRYQVKEIKTDYDKLFDAIDTTELDLMWESFEITQKDAQESFQRELNESLGVYGVYKDSVTEGTYEITEALKEQTKALQRQATYTQMALAGMRYAYDDFFGALFGTLKTMAQAWIVESIMADPSLVWYAKLIAAAGAVATIEALYAEIRGMKEGGIIPEEGIYHLHKGEVVTPASQVTNIYNKATNVRKEIHLHQVIQIGPERFIDETIIELEDRAERGVVNLPLKVIG